MVASEAYAVCRRLASEHYENFPVASWLLPRDMRPHVAAVYAFARLADDFADEGAHPDDLRLARLDDWRRRLAAAAAGRAVQSSDQTADAVFIALGETIRRRQLDARLLEDLLSAFRQDVLVKRYDGWDDLLDYCRRSANPVGRLVLQIAGRPEAATERASDALCTALQLTNFWQDLERDWRRGRLYVPLAVVEAAGAREADLDRGVLTAGWREALRRAGERTRAHFADGRLVADRVAGRLRWELRATWLGGTRILDRLERAGFDVFRHRPALGWRDAGAIAWGAVFWRNPRNQHPGTPERRNPGAAKPEDP